LPADTLAGRTALVTGASSGIGLAVARLFAERGAAVHAVARRRPEGPFIAHSCDVADQQAVERLVKEVSAAGLDILVLAAGTNLPGRRLDQLTPEAWNELIAVNLSGAFYFIQAALPVLRSAHGDAILISSVSGAWPDVSGPAYQASKAGLLGLARAAGFEEHTRGVRFSTVLPGLVDTPILEKRPQPPPREVLDLALKPEDVAAACLFLATLPKRAHVAELTILPTMLQALGKSSTATPVSAS
jgi:NAD(P)-dependent dehydrogenase (short-subunit alcohol dehydrogenase family)